MRKTPDAPQPIIADVEAIGLALPVDHEAWGPPLAQILEGRRQFEENVLILAGADLIPPSLDLLYAGLARMPAVFFAPPLMSERPDAHASGDKAGGGFALQALSDGLGYGLPSLVVIADSPPCASYSQRVRAASGLPRLRWAEFRTDLFDRHIAPLLDFPEPERPNGKGRRSIPKRSERQNELAARAARYRERHAAGARP